MSYETGTASDQADLITKMSTFLVANGWTEDEHDTGDDEFAIHINDVYVSMRYGTSGEITLHQALGFTGGQSPGDHPNDSGNGDTSAPFNSERRINAIGAGPYTAYHFFTDDASYFHMALEYAPGLYRHCSFGEMVKEGSWTGGEYCAGMIWSQALADIDVPSDGAHTILADSRNGVPADGMTVHIEGLPDEPDANTRWGVLANTTTPGNDGDGNPREILFGGMRDSLLNNAMEHYRPNPANLAQLMLPLEVYRRRVSPSPDEWMPLGVLPDIRYVNIHNFEPGQEFVVGSDTWKTFPWARKKYNPGDDTEQSWNFGIAYKKIV